jgi:hypothetical protein
MQSRIAALLLVVCAGAAQAQDAPPAEPKVTYDDHVKAIFRAKCSNCHNTDKKVAGLDLTNYTSLMAGGGSGAAVEAGDPSASYLWMVVSHESEPYMPPMSPKLDDATLAVIREWIELGAPENKGSKVAKKKGANLSLTGVPTGKPEGPPPMPPRLPLEPVRHTERPSAVTALAAAPWSPLVAVGGFNQVLLYNAQTLELVGVLPFPEGVPQVLRFSRNGRVLLAAGGRGAYQGLAVLWDITTGERLTTVGDETDSVLAADISPDQALVALGGPNKKVKVYSIATGEMVYELKKHTEWVYALEFSPDGVLLATADRNGGLIVWEAASGNEFLVLDGHKTAVNAVSWRPDSNLLASCDEEGQIRLWEMENGKTVKNWGAHGGGAKCVEFTRDGRLVSTGVDRTPKLWAADGNQQRAFAAFGDLSLRVTYAAEGDRVVAGDWTGEIRVWNAADGNQAGVLTPNPPPIQTRIDQAVAALAALKPQYEAAAAGLAAAETAVKAADAVVTKVKGDLTAAEATKVDSENKVKQLGERTAQLQAEKAKASGEAARVEAMVPGLKAAAELLRQLASNDAGAADLVQATTAADASLNARVAAAAAQRAAEKQADETLVAVAKESEALAAAVTAATQTIDALKQQIPAAEADLKAKQEQFAAAQKAAADAQAALAAAEAAVARWQDELAFAKQAGDALAAKQ